jgi:multicomponent Na+:H+ antiporter subunit C
MFDALLKHMNYIAAMALFVIGLYTVLMHQNLIKKVIGINIMETSVFLFFVSIGMIQNGQAPIINLQDVSTTYVNPIPSALILTGIVVAVSITAYSLSLIIQLYKQYGTLNLDEMVDEVEHD